MSRLLSARLAVVLVATAGKTVSAQVSRADSLLNAGVLQRAESLYYAAVRERPRDPVARWALGRYLVSRGATRVGATLFEEALQFGGDASLVGADLVPVYVQLGEFRKLSALKGSVPSNSERERARWLVAHSPTLVAPDSLATLDYRKPTEVGRLGQVVVHVNGRPVETVITAHTRGITIADTSALAKRLHAFTMPADARHPSSGTLAVADSIAFGRLSMTNVPVTIRALPSGQLMLIGLDVLARFAPTFDPAAGRLTLHISGSVPAAVGADELPMLFTRDDLRVLRAGAWISADQAQIERMLTTRRWTFDGRRGRLTIER